MAPLRARLCLVPRLGLQRQTRLATCLLLAVIVVASTAALLMHTWLARHVDQAIYVDARRSALASQLTIAGMEWRRHERGLLVDAHDEQLWRRHHENWRQARAALDNLLDQYATLTLTPVQRQTLDGWRRVSRYCREGIESVTEKRLSRALSGQQAADMIRDAYRPAMQELIEQAGSEARTALAAATGSGQRVRQVIDGIRWMIVIRGVLCAILIWLWSRWFSRRIIRRVSALAGTVARFAAGDTKARAADSGEDELSQVAQEFNEMAATICRTHAELRQAQAASQVASRLKSEFLANMSHEIRTPMTAILGFADELTDSLQRCEQREMASTIKRNGEHLLELINDILDLSKIEAGKLAIDLVPCSPAEIVDDVLQVMRFRADARQLTLSVERSEHFPEWVLSDPTRLRQILFNLVGNAVKFTMVGGVRVVLGWQPGQARGRLSIAVSDTGIGISAEQQERLFQPFTQADASTTRRFGGTGLGLAISQRLAEMLHGRIEATSQPGAGSTFTLTIAAEQVHAPPEHTAADLATQESASAANACRLAEPRRVLLAEDGADNQRLLCRVLERAGAEVMLVDNGLAAVDAALASAQRQAPFDVVLMDMQMPVLDGYEATARLRAAGYQGRIVALTAHTMTGGREKCLAAGCDDYLPKPIDRRRLIELVARSAGGDRGPQPLDEAACV